MTGPRIIAHRGFAEHHPENTIAAVRGAARHVDMMEVDTRRCGTGELVVFHDDDLERTTGVSGRLDETPLDELRELTVGDSDESVPTLDELLAETPEGLRVNLELKEVGIGAEAVDACREHGVDTIYSSFHDEAIREVREYAPDAALAVLCHESQPVDDRVALADALDADAFHPSIELVNAWTGTDTRTTVDDPDRIEVEVDTEDGLSTDTDVVALAHAFDLRVNVWTAKTSADVIRLDGRGVDGVMVDHPDTASIAP